eukprot:m.5359 g.5359  ORF g.5359 m.5359 type:complete len:66 (+) comp12955_c0_seq1:67-264(+)
MVNLKQIDKWLVSYVFVDVGLSGRLLSFSSFFAMWHRSKCFTFPRGVVCAAIQLLYAKRDYAQLT